MASYPSIIPTDQFNPSDFLSLDASLTLPVADLRYVKIGSAATLSSLNVGPLSCSALTIGGSPLDLSLISGITPGVAQVSKAMTLDSSGVILMPLGSSSSNAFKWYGGTANRETLYMYRADDTAGLIISSKTSGGSNKTYPLLELICGDPASTFGTAAVTNDLLRIKWVDSGFGTQYIRSCFNVGNGQPYKSGYPFTAGIITSGDAICLAAGGSTATPSSGCLYIVNDTQPKMLFNTNSIYTYSTFGTPNCTFNGGAHFIGNSSWNDGSANYVMPVSFSNGKSGSSQIGFGFQLHVDGTVSTNGAYTGTLTNHDYILMRNNARKLTIGSTGVVIADILTVNGSSNVSLGVGGTSIYQFNMNSNVWSNVGLGPQSYALSCVLSGSIKSRYVYSDSDKRLKKNINPLEINESHYMKFNPVSFQYRDEERFTLGFIAQEVQQLCAEMITYVPDPKMEIENPETDIEGYSMAVSYDQMTVINCAMIQKLLKRVELMEQQISELRQSSVEGGP